MVDIGPEMDSEGQELEDFSYAEIVFGNLEVELCPFEFFMLHSQETFCEETLVFWKAYVRTEKSLGRYNEEQLRAKAKDLFERFVTPSARYTICLPDFAVVKMEKLIKEMKLTTESFIEIFAPAKTQAILCMHRDIYPRFIKSAQYELMKICQTGQDLSPAEQEMLQKIKKGAMRQMTANGSFAIYTKQMRKKMVQSDSEEEEIEEICHHTFKIVPYMGLGQATFYSLFEGFDSDACSTFCGSLLHRLLIDSPHFQKLEYYDAVVGAFKECDEEWMKLAHKDNSKHPEKLKITGASCATITLVDQVSHTHLIAANVGNVRVLLGSLDRGKIQCKRLSVEHYPACFTEHERILGAGGTVTARNGGTIKPHPDDSEEANGAKFCLGLGGRSKQRDEGLVEGVACVARAFGFESAKPHVISTPHVQEYNVDPAADKFLVMVPSQVTRYLTDKEIIVEAWSVLQGAPDLLSGAMLRKAAKAVYNRACMKGCMCNPCLFVCSLDPNKNQQVNGSQVQQDSTSMTDSTLPVTANGNNSFKPEA